MTHDSLRERADRLLQAALELPPDERTPFLERKCGDDTALRALVEKLLRYADAESEWLPPGGALDGDLWETNEAETAPEVERPDATDRVRSGEARYRLLRKLGEGGMGEVYEAEELHPVRRRVAIKILKPGMDSRQVMARFAAERQALALMDHPHIARVFDAGTTADHRPFFAMELVSGEPITDYCDRKRLPVRERLALFRSVCAGVQHAHRAAVIHRDLKPSNILVTEQDDQAVPKIIDFGVAKATAQPLTEQTLYTALGQVIGTPAYMSPEQADLTGRHIDTRTDVYSLGAILYELLVGARPFDTETLERAGFEEILRTIREVEAPRPSTRVSTESEASDVSARCRGTTPVRLSGQLRGDLDWITMKALEKERDRRYDSPGALADDIERYLNNEPILARPPSMRYRVSKFVRRHTLAVSAAATVLLLLVAFSITMTIMLGVQSRERARAEREAARAERINTFLQDMLGSADPAVAQGREITVVEVLDDASAQLDHSLTDEPEVQAAVHRTIGNTYRSLGRYEDARVHIETALAMNRETLGPDDPETLRSLLDLATFRSNSGDHEEAEALAREALSTSSTSFGTEHELVEMSLARLGWILYAKGRYEEADPVHRQALALSQALHGDGPETALILDDLALNLSQLDQYAEAESIARAAVAMRRRFEGPTHPGSINSLNNLALILTKQGRYEESELTFREVLALNRTIYPEEHLYVTRALESISHMLYYTGRYAEAAEMQREVVTTYRLTLPPDHPELASGLNSLGATLTELARYEEAEDVLEESLELRRRILGDRHPDVVLSLNNLAGSLQGQGRLAEAEALHRESLELRRVIYGDDHMKVSTALLNFGLLLRKQRKYAEAEEKLREAVDIRRRSIGPEHPRTATALYNLALVLKDEGSFAEAEDAYTEALSIYRQALGSEHPSVASVLSGLGNLYLAQKRIEDATLLFQECLSIREAALPPGHRRIALARFSLGKSLLAEKRYEEAEPVLLASYQGYIATEEPSSKRLKRATDLLIQLYDEWGKPEVAATYRGE